VRLATGVLLAALATAAPAAAQVGPATPLVATGPQPSVAPFTGDAVTPRAVPGVLPAWTSPFMARNPRNSVHNDPWQTDTYTAFGGPRGRDLETLSARIGRTCITLTFDRRGRLIGSCTNLPDGPGLYLLDPRTLATLAFHQLPYVPPPAGTNPALNTTGGAYFFLDHRDRVVVAASDRRIRVYGVDDGGSAARFRQVATYDPRPCLQPDERMPSALPDAAGRLWFVGRTEGSVGVIDRRTGRCRAIVLREEIENSFAVADDGVYIVSDEAMYKFRAAPGSLRPRRVWRFRYRNSGLTKPGQINAGSGTTPTLLRAPGQRRGDTAPAFVAITDNADPMNVVVLRAGDRVRRRLVCQVPVFAKGASATENSLIGIGQSLVVENNFGYDLQRFNDVIAGDVAIGGNRALVSAPGMTRVDIRRDGSGCRVGWRNTEVRPASVVAKGDAVNGLVYLYENLADPVVPDADPWAWTAVDVRTGAVRWRRLAGWGGEYNNHYAGIALGRAPGGRPTLYLGGVGGVMALRDGA
jgi:hypothetical protein